MTRRASNNSSLTGSSFHRATAWKRAASPSSSFEKQNFDQSFRRRPALDKHQLLSSAALQTQQLFRSASFETGQLQGSQRQSDQLQESSLPQHSLNNQEASNERPFLLSFQSFRQEPPNLSFQSLTAQT